MMRGRKITNATRERESVCVFVCILDYILDCCRVNSSALLIITHTHTHLQSSNFSIAFGILLL